MTVDDYSGDASNAMMTNTMFHQFISNGKLFTTWDSDNDAYGTQNCALIYNCGWWFGKCSASNLNIGTPHDAIWLDDDIDFSGPKDVQASRMLLKLN